MATLYYPELMKNSDAFPAHIMFTFYERGDTQSSSIQDHIHLYMPENFGQPSTISWDHSFKAGQAVLGVGKELKEAYTSFGGPGFGDFMKKVIRTGQSIGAAAKDLVALQTGMTINPYYAQLFRSVDLRNFRYTFKFVPFTPRDCDTILEIINTFRRWSLPKGSSGAGSPLLSYPGECEIDYVFDGRRNKWLHRFKRSVITSLDVNYTGAGMWTMMRNGFPTETVLNVSFGELEVVLRDDVNLGY